MRNALRGRNALWVAWLLTAPISRSTGGPALIRITGLRTTSSCLPLPTIFPQAKPEVTQGFSLADLLHTALNRSQIRKPRKDTGVNPAKRSDAERTLPALSAEFRHRFRCLAVLGPTTHAPLKIGLDLGNSESFQEVSCSRRVPDACRRFDDPRANSYPSGEEPANAITGCTQRKKWRRGR